jgi:hypothetical protein
MRALFRRSDLATIALVLGLLVSAPATAGATEEKHDIWLDCTTTGQVCEPVWELAVMTADSLRVLFEASERHCSAISIRLKLDDGPWSNQTELGWLEDPLGRSRSMLVDFGPVAAGEHQLSIQAEGDIGGCNDGDLLRWGGSFRVITSDFATKLEPTTWGKLKALYR